MSLLTEAMEDFTVLNESIVDDGYGGYTRAYTDGVTIKAALTFDSSIEAMQAQAAGATELYTITTTKAINLQYHDVLRRALDGKILRVTTDGDDNKTPASAGLNMRQVRAEEWEIPDGSYTEPSTSTP